MFLSQRTWHLQVQKGPEKYGQHRRITDGLQMLVEHAEGNFQIFVDLLEIACGARAEPRVGMVKLGSLRVLYILIHAWSSPKCLCSTLMHLCHPRFIC